MEKTIDEHLLYEMGYNTGFKDGIKGSISKADYENRLKADLVAVLDEFDLRLYEQYEDTDLIKVEYVRQEIQQKIDELKEKDN